MPSSTPERQEKWKSDDNALDFLKKAGVHMDTTFYFYTDDDRTLTDDEADAICYMIEEWDYGVYIRKDKAKPFTKEQ